MNVIQLSYGSPSLKGTIELPASKSISNRALVLFHLLQGQTSLQNLSTADDTVIMKEALQHTIGKIDVKNAGTCMRFLTAYFAALPGSGIILTGDERMEQRPIGELVDALRAMGAQIDYLKTEGFPPLRIEGTQLSGGTVTISAQASSQFVSALMLIAPFCSNDVHIKLEGTITSAPYIEMTAAVMQQFGLDVTVALPEIHFPSRPLISRLSPLTSEFLIEPDWSAASYWYEMVALSETAEVFLPGLSLTSIQGDAMIADYMKFFGVCTTQTETGIVLTKLPITQSKQQTINLQHQPDLAPTLAVTAAATGTPMLLTGLQNLVIKESNRLLALETELTKLGFKVHTTADSLEIIPVTDSPSNPFEPIQTYKDHRMALAFAPLALVRPVIILEHPEVIEKSYPHFWEDLKTAGFTIN